MTHIIRQAPQHAAVRPPGREDSLSIEQLKQQLTAPPPAEELARRRSVVEHIKTARQDRSIAPMTTADLVRQAREEEHPSYGGDR